MDRWQWPLLTKAGKELGQTFRSLANKNYRLYTFGQVISLTGSHVQNVALAWVTYQITQSATLLAWVTLATFLPMFCLSVVGGMVADRYDRRKVLIGTQVVGILLASSLAIGVFTGYLSFWPIFVFSIAQGINNAIEVPVRHSFVYDLVGGKDMVNAVGINSLVYNATRFIGPAVAAFVLAMAGSGICFVLNALSFLAAVKTLRKVTVLGQAAQDAHAPQQVSFFAGIMAAFSDRRIRNILFLTCCSSFFAFQYSVLLPVVVDKILHGNASHLGILTASAACGSVIGGLLLASRGRKEILLQVIKWSSACPGIFLLFFALSSSLPVMAVLTGLISMSIGMQLSSSNSYLQLSAPSNVRGRVLSVYTACLVGAVPFGSLLTGHLADRYGVSLALAVCAAASTICSLIYIAISGDKPGANPNGQA
ncbi:MAG: MFS transporter [Candidatus Obscuribacterales bacterium]|nr:MFS transporter [Candidatus Obscuribacterales bacterium]